MTDSLGDRMKQYEECYKITLPSRLPVIIRLDGKAWHTWTNKLDKPFDFYLIDDLNLAIQDILPSIQNCILAYTQSDEVSLLLCPTNNPECGYWFGNELQKLVSVSVSMLTAAFAQRLLIECNRTISFPSFDARAFILPDKMEVYNYFVWRQQDCFRNAVMSYAQSLFSHKELHGKKRDEQLNMILLKEDKHFDELVSDDIKYGRFFTVCDGFSQVHSPYYKRGNLDDNYPPDANELSVFMVKALSREEL